MIGRIEVEPIQLGITARITRKLRDETAEVVGGVTAGSLTFVAVYKSLLAGGIESPPAFIAAAGLAAGAAGAGELAALQIKRGLQDKGQA